MITQAPIPVSDKAGRREWLGLLLLVLPTLIVSMDMTVTYLALPVLSAALRPGPTELLWITDIFGFLEAGLLIVMGSLGDRIGLRKLLLTGATAFTLASVLAAFSTSAIGLIVARGIMGIAGASLLPTVLSLIRNLFHDARQRTFAMGLYTTCFSAGTMLGPIFGGLLLDRFGWPSVFLMPVPLILLLLGFAPFLLPEFRQRNAKPIDGISAILLMGAILPIVYGGKQLAQSGSPLVPVFCLLTGGLLAWQFVRRQRRIDNPLIQLELFSDARFNAAIAALFVALFSWSGVFLFIGQYLQSVAGVNSFSAGLWMLPGAAGSVLLCMLAPVAVRYISRDRMIAIGLLVMSAGIAGLCFLTPTSLGLLAITSFFLSGGCGLTVTLGIDLVVASAPPEKAGAAAGLSETSTGFGGSFGVAALGSIGTAVYRQAMTAHQASAAARSTIGAAIQEAQHRQDPALLDFARSTFLHGVHITALVAALFIFATAVLQLMLTFSRNKQSHE
ncbi:MFS transporter [Puia sp.]|uniref:MFS transporter n=1 Tax=Puia sp. TaxID=2045100 RepID=UPI002F3F1C94